MKKLPTSPRKPTKNGPIKKRIFPTIQGGRRPGKTPENGAKKKIEKKSKKTPWNTAPKNEPWKSRF